jgi:hypothetical protein
VLEQRESSPRPGPSFFVRPELSPGLQEALAWADELYQTDGFHDVTLECADAIAAMIAEMLLLRAKRGPWGHAGCSTRHRSASTRDRCCQDSLSSAVR